SHRCGGNCFAESFDIEVAREDRARTVLLKISFETGELYKYLVFRSAPAAGGGWKLLGHIDARGQRYGSPAHRVESGEGRTWLVIRELWGRGSGMLARGEVWYEIREDGLKRVLSYPVEGYSKPCQNRLGRSYKSFLARHGSVSGVYTVPVQLLVSYNISDCSKRYDQPSLFAKGQKAYYVWNDEKDRFALDTSESDVTEEELRTVYNLEGLSAEKFIEHNFDEVLEIARNGEPELREWLKRFLTGIRESPRKAALQQALQK
ncbi:MAG TPA: hypothetical protein VNO14_01205, partial [Blastocatellia bacterium]|nr:hypothetical protein [Blastocatellia bacterium]